MKMCLLAVSLAVLVSACSTTSSLKQAKVAPSHPDGSNVCSAGSFEKLWSYTNGGKDYYMDNCCIGLCNIISEKPGPSLRKLIAERLHDGNMVVTTLFGGKFVQYKSGNKDCWKMTPSATKR